MHTNTNKHAQTNTGSGEVAGCDSMRRAPKR